METINPGFFNMEIITKVCHAADLTEAKKIAVDAIQNAPSAKPGNISKALIMVRNCNTIKKLGLSMTDFMFAHPSENLKTIR